MPSPKPALRTTPSARDNRCSVGFMSLGCAKNLVDSQVMAGVLLSERIPLARSAEEADVIVVNTCSFIEDARDESVSTIREAVELKQRGSCRAVVVTGCLPQRYGRKIQELCPGVDAVIGLDQLDSIAGVVRAVSRGESDIFQVSPTAQRLYDSPYPNLVLTGAPFAYLKISEGCDHTCAFCAIPNIRGRHRSRSIDSIVAEASSLLESGIRELDIISQDTTYYGRDLEPRTNLSTLLKALSDIGGEFWIRIHYAYPSELTDELLETMAAIPQVCRYLDVPVQHSHPDVLRSMRRTPTIATVNRLGEWTRSHMPDITLRTTCLVGFPGETDEHFEHLLAYIRETAFDHIGVFTYSPEEGTPAFGLTDVPSRETAEERRDALMEQQFYMVEDKTARLVGKHVRVLLERPGTEANRWTGRSQRYAPDVDGTVHLHGVPAVMKPGTFVNARYTAPQEYDMQAEYLP